VQQLIGLGLTFGILALLGLAFWRAYRQGVADEKAAQARRDDATEDLIAAKRDELATTDQDDIEQRLRRWQR
jgi:hypothetical protein